MQELLHKLQSLTRPGKEVSSLVCLRVHDSLLVDFAATHSFFNAFQPGLRAFGVGAGIFGVAFTLASLLVFPPC